MTMKLHPFALAVAATYGLMPFPRGYTAWIKHYMMAGGALRSLR